MIQEFEIVSYRLESGKEPFSDWLSKQQWKVQNIVISRLNRIKLGNFGDCKSVGNKIYELRIDVESGYRIYFAKEHRSLILLLCAGNKSSQKKDIQKAKKFLQRFYEKEN